MRRKKNFFHAQVRKTEKTPPSNCDKISREEKR